MSNIEKIRKEIDMYIKSFEFNGGIYDSYEAGELNAYKTILAFIDSLPEENQKPELVAKVWESEHGFRDLEMDSESFRKALEGFKDGDKVKLFIVKEDDKG